MERRVCSEARTGGGLGSFLYVWVFFTPFLFVFHRFSPTFQSFSQLYQVLQGAGWGGGVGVCVCVGGGGTFKWAYIQTFTVFGKYIQLQMLIVTW